MTMAPDSFVVRLATLGLITALCIAMGASLSAHRRDELLQAARVDVEPDHVRLEVSLTPGIEIADAFIDEIDRNGDLRLSDAEQRAYAQHVRARVALRIDDAAPLHLSFAAVRFPAVADLRSGEAAIALEMEAVLPPLSPGPHRLFFRNDTTRKDGVFLANALVPDSSRVGVTAQERDFQQRQLTVTFQLRTVEAFAAGWVWLGFACALPLASRIGRRFRGGKSRGGVQMQRSFGSSLSR